MAAVRTSAERVPAAARRGAHNPFLVVFLGAEHYDVNLRHKQTQQTQRPVDDQRDGKGHHLDDLVIGKGVQRNERNPQDERGKGTVHNLVRVVHPVRQFPRL